jgi:hypothetical protein
MEHLILFILDSMLRISKKHDPMPIGPVGQAIMAKAGIDPISLAMCFAMLAEQGAVEKNEEGFMWLTPEGVLAAQEAAAVLDAEEEQRSLDNQNFPLN